MHKFEPALQNRKAERRCHRENTRFPLSDSGGVLVLADRRSQPDRRLGNIEAEWLDIFLPAGYPD